MIQELQDAQPECEIISHISADRAVCRDLARLQQVASNLLANALTHGLPDSPVKINARADENDLVLEVWNAGEPQMRMGTRRGRHEHDQSTCKSPQSLPATYTAT